MGWPYLSHSVPQGQDQPPQRVGRRLAGLRKRGAGVPQVGQATGWGLMPHLPDLGQKRRTSRAAAQPVTAVALIDGSLHETNSEVGSMANGRQVVAMISRRAATRLAWSRSHHGSMTSLWRLASSPWRGSMPTAGADALGRGV